MKIERHLNVSAPQFFECLAESAANDVEQARGKHVPISKLKAGMSYTKHMRTKTGTNSRAHIRIAEFDPPHVYRAEISSAQGKNTISYRICEERDGIRVTYSEEFEGASVRLRANYKFMSIFYTWSAKRRAKKNLKSLEMYASRRAKLNDLKED